MKRLLTFLVAGSLWIASFGQDDPIMSILSDDIPHGEKLIEAYFTPMAESFGAGLNNGWYNTGKPHSLGGFDITFSLNTVIIPNSAEKFKIANEFGGVFWSVEDEANTIFGESKTTEMYYSPSIDTTSAIGFAFDMPKGLKTPIMPLPMIQAGIGLVKNTAIDIRYMPTLNAGKEIDVSLFGIGLKHDLLQWIPAFGDAIPMSLSLQGGYTSLNTELEVADQKVSLSTKATTINLIASKKILMLTGYAGVGYNSANTTFTTNANFDLNGVKFDENIEMTFNSNNHLRANIGLRLNITLLTIHADYTFAEYPTATLGLGVSFR